jgi:hypothetical protein
MKSFIAIALLTVMLAGCEPGSPGAIARDTPEELAKEDTLDLCNAYGVSAKYNMAKTSEIGAELLRRKALSADEMSLVMQGKVEPGVGICAVIAAWGSPDFVTHVESASHERYEYTYEPVDTDCKLCKPSYVYFTDGVVTRIRSRTIVRE